MARSKQFIFLLTLAALFGCGRDGSKDSIQVTVTPSFFQLPSGGEVQLSADVSGTLNKAVTWDVSGPLGTSISSTGRFRSPVNAGGKTATVRALSQDDPTAMGNAAITMTTFSKLSSDAVVPAGTDRIIVGGYTVPGGQTINLNGDSLIDLVSASRSGNLVAVYLGVGNGLFLKTQIPVNEPSAVIVGDFVNSGDFVADLAFASRSEQSVKIISGKDQTPQTPFPDTIAITLPLLPGQTPSALAVGRFHGDVESRNSDLVVGTEEGSIIIFLQDRHAVDVTQTFPSNTSITVGGKIIQMIPADFNGDNLTDLAVLREGAGEVLILLGDGSGGFSSPISVPFSSPPTSIALGDLNADKIIDLVAAHGSSNQVSTSNGKGDGTFLSAVYISLDSSPGSVLVEDLNLDRINKTTNRPENPMLDLAISLPSSNEVLSLYNDGTGKFIGNLRYNTGVIPRSLISGFFLSTQNPQGFQTVSLVYLSETEHKFHLLNNVTF